MNFFDSPIITNVGIILGIFFFVWRYFLVDRGIISSYKDAAEAYGFRIQALESENTTLKSENAALHGQVEDLKRRMVILENTVTGREVLSEIQKTLLPVPTFFAPGGGFDIFMKNDQQILNDLNEIKQKLREGK